MIAHRLETLRRCTRSPFEGGKMVSEHVDRDVLAEQLQTLPRRGRDRRLIRLRTGLPRDADSYYGQEAILASVTQLFCIHADSGFLLQIWVVCHRGLF